MSWFVVYLCCCLLLVAVLGQEIIDFDGNDNTANEKILSLAKLELDSAASMLASGVGTTQTGSIQGGSTPTATSNMGWSVSITSGYMVIGAPQYSKCCLDYRLPD